eukprot:3039015-Pyramimonas_sp.AAC.2
MGGHGLAQLFAPVKRPYYRRAYISCRRRASRRLDDGKSPRIGRKSLSRQYLGFRQSVSSVGCGSRTRIRHLRTRLPYYVGLQVHTHPTQRNPPIVRATAGF